MRDPIFEIIPGRLWQSGSVADAEGEARVRELGIDYVVNLNGEPPLFQGYEYRPGWPPFTEVRWEIEDGPLPDLRDLDDVVSRVCTAVSAGQRVLVHCQAGLNRSGLVTAMAVHRLTGRGGPALVGFIRRKRPGSLSNRRFAKFVEGLPQKNT